MVNFLLWCGFIWFLFMWGLTFLTVATKGIRNPKFKYGLIDIVGLVCFIGLLIRYWE